MTDLSGKVALITGAGQGIGQGVALAMAGAGVTVAVTGRNAFQGRDHRANGARTWRQGTGLGLRREIRR